MSSYSPLRELVMSRIRAFLREPEALFWTFVFPILMAVGLGTQVDPEHIPCRTISAIDTIDFVYARKLDCTIRQVSWAERGRGSAARDRIRRPQFAQEFSDRFFHQHLQKISFPETSLAAARSHRRFGVSTAVIVNSMLVRSQL